MVIDYRINHAISASQFKDLLIRSTLAARRPVDSPKTLEGMVSNSNLLVSAWDQNTLVGVARSMTDFHYACYLSDLAVDLGYQKQGIGKTLVEQTQCTLGPHCKLILIAAPAAEDYYAGLGFSHNPRCWVR